MSELCGSPISDPRRCNLPKGHENQDRHEWASTRPEAEPFTRTEADLNLAIAGAYAAAAKFVEANSPYLQGVGSVGVTMAEHIRKLTPADAQQANRQLVAEAYKAAAQLCDDHAEELIAMIGKDLGPNYGGADMKHRDKVVKDQAYTARICSQRIRALTQADARQASQPDTDQGDVKDAITLRLEQSYLAGAMEAAEIALRDASLIASQHNHEAASAICDMNAEQIVKLTNKGRNALSAVIAARGRLEALKEFRDKHDLGEQLCVIDGSTFHDYADVGSNHSETLLDKMIAAEEAKLAAARSLTPQSEGAK